MSNEVRNLKLQSALGDFKQVDNRRDMDMFGVLMVGKVTRVHHKSGTADIVIVDTGDTFKSTPNNEGRYAARFLQGFSGYNEVTKKPWGLIEPIGEGTLVVVTFLNGIKQRPIILGTLPRMLPEENVYVEDYPLMENISGYNAREALKRLMVYPSGLYEKVDGEGNVEKTYPGYSFLVNYSGLTDFDDQINDNHNGYGYEDLTEKDKDTLYTIAPPEGSSTTDNGKVLYSHRTVIDGQETFIKVYLSDEGEIRISRDNNDGALSYIELATKGDISLVRQKDSPHRNLATDLSKVEIKADGEIHMRNGIAEFSLGHDLNVRVPGRINMFEGNQAKPEEREEEA